MLKLTDRMKGVIDIVQWVLIVIMLIVCIFMYFNGKSNNEVVTSEEYQKEQTYVKIYESQTIENLKKQNRELYDSIKMLKNVETAVQIKYKYKYVSDTIRVIDTVISNDSVYHYELDNDTVNHTIDVKAKDLEWLKSSFAVNDKFIIVNKEKDGQNQITIEHSKNTDIESVDVFHRINDEDKWHKKFTISPQVGVGYGVFNKKVDVYVGVGVGYKF